jgi:hypothetical protein
MDLLSQELLCSKLERNKERVITTFSKLVENDWKKIVYKEPFQWDCRDLLSHFVSIEIVLLSLMENIKAGREGIGKSFDYDEFNMAENIKYKHYQPNELLEQFVEKRNITINWTNIVDNKVLQLKGNHPTLGEITIQEIIMSVYGHILMHLRDL